MVDAARRATAAGKLEIVGGPSADARWRRSTWCTSSSCVEIGVRGEMVLVRDSKSADALPLAYTKEEWDAFVAGVKAGEFDYASL